MDAVALAAYLDTSDISNEPFATTERHAQEDLVPFVTQHVQHLDALLAKVHSQKANCPVSLVHPQEHEAADEASRRALPSEATVRSMSPHEI